MEKPSPSPTPESTQVTVNNAADITVIIGYFVMVIGVGIWVSECLCLLYSTQCQDEREVEKLSN